MVKKAGLLIAGAWLALPYAAQAQYLGQWTSNQTMAPAAPQMPGTFNNQYGGTGNSPQLRDSEGNFRGNLNSNSYDPDSVSNPYGRYGSRYSADSVNNPYGNYGSPLREREPEQSLWTGALNLPAALTQAASDHHRPHMLRNSQPTAQPAACVGAACGHRDHRCVASV